MADQEQADTSGHAAPSTATSAVLKPSEPVSANMRQVEGIDFDKHAESELTVSELLAGMANMGFQASAVSEAARIIDNMVTLYKHIKTNHYSYNLSIARVERPRYW